MDEKRIPEDLIKAVMRSCGIEHDRAADEIKYAVEAIHEWMDKGVDPARQTGYGSSYYMEQLEGLGLDADWELDFAELCNYTYQPKEKFYLYLNGIKEKVFTDQDDAEDEAVTEFETGSYKTVEVKNSKGEVIFGTDEIKKWIDDYNRAESSRCNVEERRNGEWWFDKSFGNLEDAKERAFDVYETTGHNVRIVNGFGKVVCHERDILKEYRSRKEEARKERESRGIKESANIFESFLGNRQKGGFDAAKVIRNLKDGRYDSEKVINACVSALEDRQKSALAHKLVKQLQSDGILAKVFKRSGEFGTKEQ